jgi:hypothetical protein
MTTLRRGPADYAQYRSYCLEVPTPAEARLVGRLADRLRHTRAAAGWSRAELAARLNVEPALVVVIENGCGPAALARAVVAAARAAARVPK